MPSSIEGDDRISELRPNKRLLDPNFDCYRLANDQLKVVQHKFKESISSRPELTPEQFGLCHIELRARLNGLVHDVFHPGSVFYTSHGKVYHARYHNNALSEPSEVFSFDAADPNVSVEQSEPNIFLVSGEFCLLLNREGKIDLLKTEQRHLGKPFTKLLSVETGVSDGVLLSGKGRRCFDEGRTQVDALICSVKEKTSDESHEYPESAIFLSLLTWLTFEGKSAADGKSDVVNWQLLRTRTLCGTSVPKSASFLYNSRATHLLLCVEGQCKFKSDSVVPVTSEDSQKDVLEDSATPPLYTYIQSNEDAVVVFRLEANTSKNDVSVVIKPSLLEIKICDEVVLEGILEAVVDSGSSTWSIVDDKLEVTLMKCRPQRWKRVVKGNTKGEEVFDAAYLDEVHERLRHLTASDEDLLKAKSEKSQNFGGAGLGETTEECDEAAEEFALMVFNGETHSRDWFLDLSGHQFIMEVPSKEGPLIVLRHQVDGLVWKFDFDQNKQDHIIPQHLSTLHAFGYVSASKQDKLFMTCYIPAAFEEEAVAKAGGSPGARGEYGAIIAMNGQIFIYKSPEPVEGCELKNRKTGQVQHVAKQYAIRLEGAGLERRLDGVLGAAAGNGALFVLTKGALHVVTVK